MASQILPVWCRFKVGTFEDGTPILCSRRGSKAHGGLCPKHRREMAEAEARERKGN